MTTAFDTLMTLSPTLRLVHDGSKTQAGRPAPHDDFWYQTIGQVSAAGVMVTPDSAMRASAVYACVRVLAETIASLPCHMYRRLPSGGKERAPDHPLYDILNTTPNNWQTAVEFWEMAIYHLSLRGNFYAEIIPGRRGFVDQLKPLHPDRVKVERLVNGRLRFIYNDPDKGEIRLTQDEVFRPIALSSNGYTGLSVIEHARNSIGLALVSEDFSSRFFSNGAHPSGVISHPNKLDDAASKRLAKSFHQAYSGKNAFMPAVLEEGSTWTPITMTAKDSQFLEGRKFQIEEIARLFRIPLHMIGSLEHATFSNIEHQSIDFVVHTIRPWCRRLEQAISRDLILDTRNYYAEFLVDGLLRGDAATRAEYYSKALGSGGTKGWLTQNEVRSLENRNPMDGGDDLPQPTNQDFNTNDGAQSHE